MQWITIGLILKDVENVQSTFCHCKMKMFIYIKYKIFFKNRIFKMKKGKFLYRQFYSNCEPRHGKWRLNLGTQRRIQGGGQGGSAPRPANGELRASHFLNLKLKSEDHKKLVCGPEPPWQKSEWKIYLECIFILIGWLSGIAN